MAYSYQEAVSDGSLQTVILSIDFFGASEISVYLDGVLQTNPTNYVWATANSIQFTVPVPNGVVVKIQRRTDISEMRHIFAEGALYSDNTIDEDYEQILRIAQENLEGRDLTGPLSDNLDMGEHRIINLANPIDQYDAVNLETLQTYAFDSSAVLRADLLVNGSERVARPGGQLVEAALDAIEAKDVTQDINITNLFAQQRRKDLAVAVSNVHFGVQCGVGWNSIESGNLVTTTTTGASASGALTINVVNGLIFTAGQLFVYTATDGNRYTAVVSSRIAGSITADRQLRAIASGATIANFYRDDAHPNAEGAYAVADNMIEVVKQRTGTETYKGSGVALWTALASGVITAETGSVYPNPGDTPDGGRGTRITSSAANGGAQSIPIALADGDYEIVLDVNPGERSGPFSGAQVVRVDEYAADGTILTVATTTISGFANGGSQRVVLPISVRAGSSIRVAVTTPNSGSSYCILGTLRIHRMQGFLPSITSSKIVLFGDSWFTSGGDIHNAMIARLPNATVVSAGVPGNRADQGIARFVADVASQNPDVVYVCFSTNDYYQDVTLSNFNQQIHQIRRMIREIGAIPVFLDATVGAITPTLPLPNQLTKSRKFYQFVEYRDADNFATGVASRVRKGTYAGFVTVPASGSIMIACSPAQTRGQGWITGVTINQSTMGIRAGYSTSVDGAGLADILNLPAATTLAEGVAVPRTVTTNGLSRFLAVLLVNATGTPTLTGYSVEIEWFTP